MENPLSGEEISDYLFSRSCEVSPQQLKAAWMFVALLIIPYMGIRVGVHIFHEFCGD
jgi:hypothetical protein